MRKAIQSLSLLVLIVLTCNGLLGCSGSQSNPAIPPESPAEQVVEPATDSGRSLWGIWAVEFDTDQLTVTIEPIRNPQAHYNITNMVTLPACDDCVMVEVLWFEPVSRVLGVEVTMRNPTNISAYDVRGILYTNDYGHLLTDADDWTGLWDMPGGQMLNPFKAFAKGEPNRLFAGEAEHSEYYKIYVPLPAHFNAITFAVDVSWPGNCKEPYEITNFSQETILDTTGSSGNIYLDVHDWQADVNKVTLVAPEITGEDFTQFTHLSGDTWNLLLQNNEGASAGEYKVRLIAASTNSLDLPLYDYIDISIASELPTDGWARTWGGSQNDEGYGIAIDANGNAYITGQFEATVDFNPGPGVDEYISDGETDIFLSKFNSDGNFQWARTWGSGSSNKESGYGVAIDGSGNAYITGHFSSTVDFDPGPGVDKQYSNGYSDIFLSKFDSSGNFQWARTWGGESAECAWGVAIDGSGNAYVTGYFGELVDFDPGPGIDQHFCNGEHDIFLSKFDSAGVFQWARTWGGSGNEHSKGVAIDGSGNAYITGNFRNTVDFDPGPEVDEHTSSGDYNIFLSKFDSAGVFQWARTWGDCGYNFCEGVAIDGNGNAYITGVFCGTTDFDPGPGVDKHTPDGWCDAFLSKFNSAGDFQWACTWGGNTEDKCKGVAIDEGGNAYITGYFQGTVDFDPGPGVDEFTAYGYKDIFLSKFDSNGVFQWARTWGGNDFYLYFEYDRAFGVATDGSGNAYVTGGFRYTADFDPGPGVDEHTSNGYNDIFLSKFPPDGNW